MLGILVTQQREFQKQMHENVKELRETNEKQDAISNELRRIGFERLSKAETLLEAHQQWLERHETELRTRGPSRAPSKNGEGGL